VRKTLAFAAIVEIGTGLALMIDPGLVVRALLGAMISPVGTMLGRCFGIALLALGVACWPGRQHVARGSPAIRAMSIYSALIALYLVYIAWVEHLGGALLWPAIATHAVVTGLLLKRR
jgi:hypothetical protein